MCRGCLQTWLLKLVVGRILLLISLTNVSQSQMRQLKCAQQSKFFQPKIVSCIDAVLAKLQVPQGSHAGDLLKDGRCLQPAQPSMVSWSHVIRCDGGCFAESRCTEVTVLASGGTHRLHSKKPAARRGCNLFKNNQRLQLRVQQPHPNRLMRWSCLSPREVMISKVSSLMRLQSAMHTALWDAATHTPPGILAVSSVSQTRLSAATVHAVGLSGLP